MRVTKPCYNEKSMTPSGSSLFVLLVVATDATIHDYKRRLADEEDHSRHPNIRGKEMGAATSRKWSSGLCGCGGSLGTFCMTCWLPCVTFGRNAEILDEGRTSFCTHCCIYALLSTVQCQWVYSCVYREKLRSKYGLPDEPCCDCCVHFCCEPCALCQEHAELESRGFDASKGWGGRPTVPPLRVSMFK